MASARSPEGRYCLPLPALQLGRRLELAKKRRTGVPKQGSISFVVTDIEGYSSELL
jgi:hypothetical protein